MESHLGKWTLLSIFHAFMLFFFLLGKILFFKHFTVNYSFFSQFLLNFSISFLLFYVSYRWLSLRIRKSGKIKHLLLFAFYISVIHIMDIYVVMKKLSYLELVAFLGLALIVYATLLVLHSSLKKRN